MLGSIGSISPLFLVLYFALSLQADREDLDQDKGQIKTIASLLGARTSGYLVIFLIALSAYLLLIPLTETLILLVVMNRERFLPKRSFDSLLFLLGLYFLFG
jgi:4-hydroxybenzoate polyprenyltransferase